ncbi:hypothetical protein HDU98_001825 [Podochytrium sp. JEL0797]|nr:hypothetical protein HDU98_001825 [Podochytrium sp. JEL0797]
MCAITKSCDVHPDRGHMFCGGCGTRQSRIPIPVVYKKGACMPSDRWDKIAARITTLDRANEARELMKKRGKQSTAFIEFLTHERPFPISLAEATPSHVREFLINKEFSGNTQHHRLGCPHLGKATPGFRTLSECDGVVCGAGEKCPHASDEWKESCPVRSNGRSLRTVISHLKNDLKAEGLTNHWDPLDPQTNPVMSQLVDTHQALIDLEDRASSSGAVQAVPLFGDEVDKIASEIERRIAVAVADRRNHTSREILILRLDLVFLFLAADSGRRPGDLAELKPQCMMFMPRLNAIIVAMFETKTANSTRLIDRFVITERGKSDSRSILRALRALIAEAKISKWDINTSPYLFPRLLEAPSPHELSHNLKPSSLRIIERRFDKYMEAAGLQVRGTALQGLRIAEAIRETRDDSERVFRAMINQAWATQAMANRYSALRVAMDHMKRIKDKSPEQALSDWVREGVKWSFFNKVAQDAYSEMKKKWK